MTNSYLIPLLLSIFAGFSTLFGGMIFLFFKEIQQKYLSLLLGLSVGTMIYISFVELIPYSLENIGFLYSNMAFFAGMYFIMIIDYIVPHHDIHGKSTLRSRNSKLMGVGVMTAIGLAIHNFPEGMTVFMSSLVDLRSGYVLACATALHNIPEGIAVAIPIYLATKSRKRAIFYTFLSGMAEPFGAVVTFFLLKPFLTPELLAGTYAFVAGVMIFISLDELLPSSFENGHGRDAVLGIITGMVLVFLTLYLI